MPFSNKVYFSQNDLKVFGLLRLVYKNISGITIEYFSINIKNFTVFRHVDENFLVFVFSLRYIVQL